MRYALFALALVTSSVAFAQTAYTPPEVRITRTDVQNGACVTGTIRVSGRDDVTISLHSCGRDDGSLRSITSTSQGGGITVTNSPGAVTGSNITVDQVRIGNGRITVTGVSGMALSGVEEPIVRRCLADARAARTNRNRVYLACLRSGLGPEGYTVG